MLNDTSHRLEALMPAAFSFIGLQDRWNESVCLIHVLRGSYPVLPVEVIDTRPTPKTGIDWDAEAEACGLEEQLRMDKLDDRVYDLATQNFENSLREAEKRFPLQ